MNGLVYPLKPEVYLMLPSTPTGFVLRIEVHVRKIQTAHFAGCTTPNKTPCWFYYYANIYGVNYVRL